MTDCGKYLIVSPVKDCRDNLLFYADLTKQPELNGKLHLTQIVHKFEADYEVHLKFLSFHSCIFITSSLYVERKRNESAGRSLVLISFNLKQTRTKPPMVSKQRRT